MSNGNMGSDKTYRVVANSTDIEVITAAGDAFAANSSSLNAGNRALSIHGSYYTTDNYSYKSLLIYLYYSKAPLKSNTY